MHLVNIEIFGNGRPSFGNATPRRVGRQNATDHQPVSKAAQRRHFGADGARRGLFVFVQRVAPLPAPAGGLFSSRQSRICFSCSHSIMACKWR